MKQENLSAYRPMALGALDWGALVSFKPGFWLIIHRSHRSHGMKVSSPGIIFVSFYLGPAWSLVAACSSK